MLLPTKAQLRLRATSESITASIEPLTPKIAVNNFGWWTDAKMDDSHWPWVLFATACESDARSFGRAIVCDEGVVQGAVYAYLDSKTRSVQVSRLATAPWNRKELFDSPKYSGVGTALLTSCMCFSHSIGYDGKLTLSSLDLPHTLKFYAAFGFKETGSVDGQGLKIFEMDTKTAQALLKGKGIIP